MFSWDDISAIVLGVVIVLRIGMKQYADPPAWLYFAVSLFAFVVGIREFIYYRRKRKAGKGVSFGLSFSVFY